MPFGSGSNCNCESKSVHRLRHVDPMRVFSQRNQGILLTLCWLSFYAVVRLGSDHEFQGGGGCAAASG